MILFRSALEYKQKLPSLSSVHILNSNHSFQVLMSLSKLLPQFPAGKPQKLSLDGPFLSFKSYLPWSIDWRNLFKDLLCLHSTLTATTLLGEQGRKLAAPNSLIFCSYFTKTVTIQTNDFIFNLSFHPRYTQFSWHENRKLGTERTQLS